MKTLLCGALLCAATFGQDIPSPQPRTTNVTLSLDQGHWAFTAEQGNNLLFNTPTGALAFFFPVVENFVPGTDAASVNYLETMYSQSIAGHLAPRTGFQSKNSPETGFVRTRGRWVPQGTRGWVVGSDLFLEPSASYQVAQQVAGTERLPLSEQTLRHRLREHGLLASIDAGRQMLQVRRTLEGAPRQVLHMNARDLLGPLSETG